MNSSMLVVVMCMVVVGVGGFDNMAEKHDGLVEEARSIRCCQQWAFNLERGGINDQSLAMCSLQSCQVTAVAGNSANPLQVPAYCFPANRCTVCSSANINGESCCQKQAFTLTTIVKSLSGAISTQPAACGPASCPLNEVAVGARNPYQAAATCIPIGCEVCAPQ